MVTLHPNLIFNLKKKKANWMLKLNFVKYRNKIMYSMINVGPYPFSYDFLMYQNINIENSL